MVKNYLGIYGTKKVSKFQEGGAPMAPEAAPAPEGGGAGQLEEMLMQVVQTQDPNLALEFCNMLAEQTGMSGAPAAPTQAAPAGGVPMGRRGMRLQPRFSVKGTL